MPDLCMSHSLVAHNYIANRCNLSIQANDSMSFECFPCYDKMSLICSPHQFYNENLKSHNIFFNFFYRIT